ncbi:MAG: carbon monoxide dehydrogenase subunit G [Sphingomonadales bacterium]|nr:carbon monoxide dehydrogenase subunit G [Sphingomonadales bacterium]
MDLKGERFIPQPRETVWQALNDIDILKNSIPGCEEISWSGDNALDATVKAKVGPVKATFKGSVTLEDINAPESYTIKGQGKGGAAGFAKGSAHVTLDEEDGGTRLHYTVDATVGGKLAQVGSRLIQGTANKLSAEFFDALTLQLGGEVEKNEESEDEQFTSLPTHIWVGGIISFVALTLWYFAK